MRAIITGSEGFIGLALARELERRGIEVTGIDRKSGREAADIARYAPKEGVDAVFHLAAQTSVFNDDLQQIRRDNIDTFMAVAGYCNASGAKLVYASSSAANPANTTSLYGLSKYFDEQYALLYVPNSAGVRLHNVYGRDPRQGTLLWHLLNEPKVTLYNGGANIRHFTYIDDAVEGLIYAFNGSHRLVNVANPDAWTVKRFAAEARRYRDVGIDILPGVRERDCTIQSIDTTIHWAQLDYTPATKGIALSVRADSEP